MSDELKPDGYCGLYCAACPSYGKGSEPCEGCKSDNVRPGWCSRCSLKACARAKGLDYCSECSDYPCGKLIDFANDPDYPYHSEIYEYQALIRGKGKEKWLEEMKKRWSCPRCGTPFNWWTLICGKCGYQVNGYKVSSPH